MSEIEKINHVFEYNDLMGVETLNPLVSVVDWSIKCGDMRYGRHYYDYQEGTLVFLAPGQVYGIENHGTKVQPKGWALVFHPDLIRGTSLGRHIDDYTFFSYEVNEALHISEQERGVVMECLHNIAAELQHAIDKHSRMLIVSNIELLLNYCMRFYDRQFITRSNENKDVIVKFERLLRDYLPTNFSSRPIISAIWSRRRRAGRRKSTYSNCS